MQRVVRALLVIFTVFVIVILAQMDYKCDWTGFGYCVYPKQEKQEVRLEKTLWDWLQLLIVPAVLAVGAYALNQTEKLNEQRRTEYQAKLERKRLKQREEIERAIAKDNQQEAILQTYLDRMSELLFDKNLGQSKPASQERAIVRARTVTVLRRLDSERKGIILHFLHNSSLISHHDTVIDLNGADFVEVTLDRAHLEEVNLTAADFRGATLKQVYLGGSYLSGANFTCADLSNANLDEARLSGANFTKAQLSEARFTKAHAYGVKFIGANLKCAEFTSANLTGANFSGADLSYTNFTNADLTGADFSNADVSTTNFTNAKLDWALLP